MPSGKRARVVPLTQTRKKGSDGKKKLISELKQALDEYEKVFIFTVRDMRNAKLKDVRTEWKDSRFFLGKNKVMTLALGRTASSEAYENLHKVSKCLKGQCGLLLTNRGKEDVVSFFDGFSEIDFARSGNKASETVVLPAGKLPDFAHSLEPFLRVQLGMKTKLERGVIHLLQDHVVCKSGEPLTPEQAKLLKLLDRPMAEFKIHLLAVWSKDGVFESLSQATAFAEHSSDEENDGGGSEGMEDD